MGDLAEFAASMPDNVKVMTYCLDGEYAGDSVKEVLEENGFEGVTIISGDGDIKTFDSEIMYTPTTVFVDSEGGMAGEAVIGATGSLVSSYTESVNSALESLGKAGI